jgi:Tfp pilus assembly protein PilW
MELMIAMAIFTLVAGAAFSLFGQHAKMVTQQQNLSGVNIGMRNAMAQMEMDLSGAGGNLLANVNNAPPFYFSVIINNNLPNVAATCTPNTTNWSYPASSACYDSLVILSPNNSLAKPCTTAGGTQAPVLVIGNGPVNVSAATTLGGNDPNNPGVAATLTADATCFKNGDELLVLTIPTNQHVPNTCDVIVDLYNFCLNVVTLTADASVSGGLVQLSTSAAGSSSTDPLGIVYEAGGQTNFNKALHNNFANGDYIVDLGTGSNAVTYSVLANPANANDPQLVRCPGTVCTSANDQVVADQVIGFKVGADLWNNGQANATDIANYIYNGNHYCSDAIQTAPGPPPTYVDCTVNPPAQYDPFDYTLVRAVRVSLIGRTTPRTEPTLNTQFFNGFDNGPYLVQQASVVVDLRNLSNVDSID